MTTTATMVVQTKIFMARAVLQADGFDQITDTKLNTRDMDIKQYRFFQNNTENHANWNYKIYDCKKLRHLQLAT